MKAFHVGSRLSYPTDPNLAAPRFAESAKAAMRYAIEASIRSDFLLRTAAPGGAEDFIIDMRVSSLAIGDCRVDCCLLADVFLIPGRHPVGTPIRGVGTNEGDTTDEAVIGLIHGTAAKMMRRDGLPFIRRRTVSL